MKRTAVLIVALGLASAAGASHAQQQTPTLMLAPTNHPRLPRDLSQLWMAPDARRPARTAAQQELAAAVKLEVDGNFSKALPFFLQTSMRQGPLAPYADYYTGLAQQNLGRLDEARRTFQALLAKEPVGYLAEAAALREAETQTGLGDHAAALASYEKLSKARTTAPDDVLMRLGRAARLAGNPEKATQAFGRVYYEFPLSDWALSAGAELGPGAIAAGSTRYTLGLERAEKLFAAKRYAAARNEFESLRAPSRDDDRELVNLRIAECEYFLKRPRNARSSLQPYLAGAKRQGEALYFYGLSLRELKADGEYVKTMRRVSAEFPTQTWADDALDDLATYHIKKDQDDEADAVLRDLYRRFPTGHNGEFAAWTIGWRDYRTGSFAEAARVFERAASDYPRSDYRPMWLYWAGRAHEALKEPTVATARYILELTDYAQTYHGRLAARRLADLGGRPPERPLLVDGQGTDRTTISQPPNAPVIRALLALDLFDQAVDELKYAQQAWGNSSPVEATLAWTYWQQGRSATGSQQFTLYRGAINAMKRAYPHYLAAGGEELPDEILRMIFPLAYWENIKKYASEYGLDPYVCAALIAQESTFVADIKSYANAWGLTQLMAPTARQYARTLKIAYTPKLLTNPDANLRVGMYYFAAKIREFGAVHLALASYNAGESRVHRWVGERPGLPQDEFIDDIPYAQTNNYVKKILSTAEDYRRLYGSSPGKAELLVADLEPLAAAKAPPVRGSSTAAGAAANKPKPAPKAPKKTTARKKVARKAS